jgi:TPR repeat protein
VPTKAGAQIPAARRLADRQLRELLARGDVFLRAGDLTSARLFYERAADAGDGQAAFRVGATFDPTFLASAGLRNLRGDLAKARLWYHRALGLGASEAQPHLNNLETK